MATLEMQPITASDHALSKALDEFVIPATPIHSAPVRRLTISGRVTENPDDTVVQMYAEKRSEERMVTHPRDLAKSWKPGTKKYYVQLRTMRNWLDANVRAYLNTSRFWQAEIFPQRLLYAYGLRGNGRLTCLTDFCCEQGINLLFVRHSFHPKDMFFSIFEKAKQMEPCIIYVNSATSIFSNPSYTSEFMAAYSSVIVSSAMNIWVVLAGSFSPKKLVLHGQHSSHPIYKMIERRGSVVHVPCINDVKKSARVAIDFLRELTQHSESIPRDYRRTPWEPVVDHMARAFLFHTMQEIRDYMSHIISNYNIECARGRGPFCMPPPSVFITALDRLPTTETSGQYHRKLFTRLAYEEHLAQTKVWDAFVLMTGASPCTYTYTPSCDIDHDKTSLYSLGSPSRDYEPLPIIPLSAPAHRTSKRQREGPRHQEIQSDKPLSMPPAPKRHTRNPSAFFRNC